MKIQLLLQSAYAGKADQEIEIETPVIPRVGDWIEHDCSYVVTRVTWGMHETRIGNSLRWELEPGLIFAEEVT